MKNLMGELNKIDKMSSLMIKIFSLLSVLAVIIGYVFTVIMKNTEIGRYLAIMSASLMAEGVWGGILLDCIKRRAGS